MPDGMVINTGPLIALAIGVGHWDALHHLGVPVVIPAAVIAELRAGPPGAPGRDLAEQVPLALIAPSVAIPAYLEQTLDAGEASVIATALAMGLPRVAIDETAGRRVARTCGLTVTGALGLLVIARRSGYAVDMAEITRRMRAGGVWLSDRVVAAACAPPHP